MRIGWGEVGQRVCDVVDSARVGLCYCMAYMIMNLHCEEGRRGLGRGDISRVKELKMLI
jgi:hypothetical protein